MPVPFKKNQVIVVKKFSFTNSAGGTGMSDWKWDEKFEGVAEIKVTKVWEDYEIGRRGWGEAVSQDLKDYLDRNASILDHRIFFGEFDL